MAVWSEAPPLTASCLSPLPGFESRPGHVKVASDLGLGGGFAGYSGFLHYLQPVSHELATIGINVTKNGKILYLRSYLCGKCGYY